MREKQSVQAIRRGVRVNSKIAIKLEFIRFVAIFILRLGTDFYFGTTKISYNF